MPTVSVLITNYNQCDTLSQAVDSVLEQTREPDEIVVIDAASKDGSESLIEDYSDAHAVINPIYLDADPGIPAMRNIALEVASCDLYTFLDGDDWFYPQKLERELKTYKTNPDCDIVYSNFEYVNGSGKSAGIWADETPPTGNVYAEAIARRWPDSSLFRSPLVSKAVLQSVGEYDEGLTIYEDWEFKIRLSKEATVSYCPNVLSTYRTHEGGVSSRVPARVHEDSMRYILEKHRPDPDCSESIIEAFDEGEKVVDRRIAMAYAIDGQRITAVKKYLKYLREYPTEITGYQYHSRVFLPDWFFFLAKRVRGDP